MSGVVLAFMPSPGAGQSKCHGFLGAAVWGISAGGKSLSSWSSGRDGGPRQVVGLTCNNVGYREQVPVCKNERRKATLESGQPTLSWPCCSGYVTLGWLLS